MRVGIVAFLQESNTFLPCSTGMRQFEEDVLLEGEAVRDAFAGAHHEIGGFFQGLSEARLEAVPIFAARALPYGVVERETFERLLERILVAVREAEPIDGLLIAAHGATVAEHYPDADGHVLKQLSKLLGLRPMIGTLDLHANLSADMIAACDALIGYQTNPHLDQRERGREAAQLMARTLAGEVRPEMAAAFPPVAINIEAQLTAEPPCRHFYERVAELMRRPEVVSHTILLGFPYADVAEMGSSVIVVTDTSAEVAAELAAKAGADLWQHRADFAGNFLRVDEALDQAEGLEGPVCLLDMGDNVGGGSPGDATHLVHALHGRAVGGAFACLADAASAEQARIAGVGKTVQLSVGGRSGPLHGQPLECEFTVLGLYDGRFSERAARHGGFTEFDQGPTAIVRTVSGLTLMLTTRRVPPFSLAQLTSCGLQPESFRLLVAKGVHAPVAAYQAVCRDFLRVDTPGVTRADMRKLDYQHRRRPLFPFEDDEMDWTPTAISYPRHE